MPGFTSRVTFCITRLPWEVKCLQFYVFVLNICYSPFFEEKDKAKGLEMFTLFVHPTVKA